MTIDLKKDVGGDPILLPLRDVEHCVVYLCSQQFGGPEEGGWYFECGEPVISVPLIFGHDVNAQIEQRLERWADQYNEEWSPRYRWDKEARVRIQHGHAVKSYPDYYPSYE